MRRRLGAGCASGVHECTHHVPDWLQRIELSVRLVYLTLPEVCVLPPGCCRDRMGAIPGTW